jgi:hypothetical protein
MLPYRRFQLQIQNVVIWNPSLYTMWNASLSWIPSSYPEHSGTLTSHGHDNAQQKATAYSLQMLEVSHSEGNAVDLVLVRVVAGPICWTQCNCQNVHGHHPIQSHVTGQMPALNAVVICIFLISNFCCVLNVVCFLLGNSPASEFYMPRFRNTPSVPSSRSCRYEESFTPTAYEDGTDGVFRNVGI